MDQIALPRWRPRRALALLEVLMVALLIGSVFLALMTAGGSIHRRGHVSEGRAVATLRARALLDLVRVVDFSWLASKAAPGSVGRLVPLDDLVESPARVILFSPLNAGPGTTRYLARLQGFSDEILLSHPEPDLVRVDVKILWRDPVPGATPPEHRVELSTVLSRPEASFGPPTAGVAP